MAEFTDKQLAQLRSLFEDSVRGVVRSELSQILETSGKDLPVRQTPASGPAASSSEVARKPFDPPTEMSETKKDTSEAKAETPTEKRSNSKTSDKGELAAITPSREALQPPSGRFGHMRYLARRLVHGSAESNGATHFDGVMGCIIVANSVVIAFETQMRVDNEEPGYLFWLETCFLICFVLELAVRWVSDGMRNLSSAWFWFDAILVVTGMISTWLVESIRHTMDDDVPLISQVLALRVLRLFRLVRALRTTEQFQELWKLCSGLVKSAGTMLSVCLVVLVAIFVFACMGVDMITFSETLARNDETDAIVKAHFYSLPMIMLTLMQFANADSIAGIYSPLCREQPLLVPYFLVLWLVVTVALMNLVTAIIVESAMGQGQEAAEERTNELRKVLRRILPEIQQVFDNLDEDGSGSLAIKEIQEAAKNGSLVMPEGIKEYVAPEKLKDVFEFLDVDQSGEIDKSEFVDGICTLVVSTVPIETTQILQLLRQTHRVLMETHDAVGMLTEGRSRGQTVVHNEDRIGI